MLTQENKYEIKAMRIVGLGYKKIAKEIGLTRDSVRYFCKQVGLDGVAAVEDSPYVCRQCGVIIHQKANGRERYYCSDECRRDWWDDHPENRTRNPSAMYKIECSYCGEVFESYGNKTRKYCCHEHYIAARFGKEPPDIEIISRTIESKREAPILTVKNLTDSSSVLVNPNELSASELPENLALNRIFLILDNFDFRGKFDRFASRVPHLLEMNLINGDAFAFCNRQRTQISVLQFQGDGFALYFKRLDCGNFPWPTNAVANVVEISKSDFKMILECPRLMLRLAGN